MDVSYENITSCKGINLKYRISHGKSPYLVWLCGYHSDMSGSKAAQMMQIAIESGHGAILFDYSGTGLSDGNFEDFNISDWKSDGEEILKLINGDIILVGSSMGGWISLLLATTNPNIKGLVLIAPAPDFTKDLMWDSFSPEQKQKLETDGYLLRKTDYDINGYKITNNLIKDGEKHILLNGPININCPVRIIHGMQDEDVPFERSIILAQKLKSQDVKINFIKSGNHRLSEPDDLNILAQTLKEIIRKLS